MAKDQGKAIEKAKEFALTRYYGERDNILREHEQKIAQVRSQLAARGLSVSGAMVAETARIHGEQVRAITLSRLEGILEGYELYEVPIDDGMAINICDQVTQEMNQLIVRCDCPTFGGSQPAQLQSQYPRMVAQAVGLSANLIKTQIDRRRLTVKKKETATTVYSVQGENSRLNLNATDNSVNIVVKSDAELFAKLQATVKNGVADEAERKKIIEAVSALEKAQGKPSFAERYTDLVAVAANHMTVLQPFIPALTEMLRHILKASIV